MESIDDPIGLFSLLHKRQWAKKNLRTYCVYLDEGNFLKVKVDNSWDDEQREPLSLPI